MLEALRARLSAVEALPQLSLLGLICGCISALVILLFRYLIEGSQGLFLPDGGTENYELLANGSRIFLLLAGGLLVGLLLQLSRPNDRAVGVLHVVERLNDHQGRLPWRNAVQQFIGGAVAIITGFSVGREGPGVHLGAASSSLLGQWSALPNNSLRVLVACGTAAAIAASFNTPLAGVIFAVEVVMMEYTLGVIIPVVVAAVTGAVLARGVYGDDLAFVVPPTALQSLLELPYLMLAGLVLGLAAALLVWLTCACSRRAESQPVLLRIFLAVIVMMACSSLSPAVMGIGYDTINQALQGHVAVQLLLLIAVVKLVATAWCVGMGVPGGLIGPTLVVGAALGGVMGGVLPETASGPGLYVVIGMCAMMGATLQAPLAALMFILELTAHPDVILPGMLTIVVATLTCRIVCRQPPMFVGLLLGRGLDHRRDLLSQSLLRVGVTHVMNTRFMAMPAEVERDTAERALGRDPEWILIQSELNNQPVLLSAADLARALLEKPEATKFKLLEIPGDRREMVRIDPEATLLEARELLEGGSVEALYVERRRRGRSPVVFGVLTPVDIERGYRLLP
ncbi:MAG: chloride channel protein [Gammaproteobacteria bacterium]|nr:chloride channel protein [Gammaproteobacteria bacterium]